MKFKRIVANIAGIVGLFFAFIVPVGRMVFSDAWAVIVVRVTSWFGIYRNAEPLDSLIDASFFLSLLLAVSVVWLANLFINRRNRKHANVK